jgi:exodeoxyribonuclease VII large subunit
VGELLARLERLKRLLHAEGLFAAERKRRPPFLPCRVGLITGRASAAERDVLENARRRWPAVRFRVENVAVQGPTAVPSIVDALHRLQADPEVDVIVIARGGGSVEDLLPFSDETLLRAVVACRTPVVSAIGHEPDTPLLDLAADLRCSTPTDAGRRIVPDMAEEQARLDGLRARGRRQLQSRLDRAGDELATLRHRGRGRIVSRVDSAVAETRMLRDRGRRCLLSRVDAAVSDLEHARARVTALSPAATLRRGYAVVQRGDGVVVRRPSDVDDGASVRIRLAEGSIGAVVGGG